MGRELRRVPMDFDWPINKTWKGYVNPHYEKCPDCKNGSTEAKLIFDRMVYLLMMLGEDKKPHPWLCAIPTLGVYEGMNLPKELSEITTGLAGRSPDGRFGHDSCDKWNAQKKILAAAGLTEKWGWCKTCDGEAIHPDLKEKYEAWENYNPPEGPGYQLWETTSEGSPQSPVFETLDELCEYAEDNVTTFGYQKTSAENWKQMLQNDFVCHKEGNMTFI